MSKELEALRKKILKNCRCDIKCLEYDNLLKALTPPTEEEVCEALREYFGEEVFFAMNSFHIRHSDGSSVIIINTLAKAPHLITMIGRFFESKNS